METGKACDREHDFTLVLTGISELTDKVEDALFEAGCDDATLAIRSGRFYLTFSRIAGSLKDAILSAIHDVRRAGIGADVLRVDACNLVTQAEIARRIDRSRQLIGQYIAGTRGPGGFPAPVCHMCDDEAPLWYWCEVAHWLGQHDMIDANARLRALQIDIINNLLEWRYTRQIDPRLADEILSSIGQAE